MDPRVGGNNFSLHSKHARAPLDVIALRYDYRKLARLCANIRVGNFL
jgi:hypothetical protein